LLSLNAAPLGKVSRLPSIIDGPVLTGALTVCHPRQQVAGAAAIQLAISSGVGVIQLPANDFRQTREITDLLAGSVRLTDLLSFRFAVPNRPAEQLWTGM
jgi:hypothetical protein